MVKTLLESERFKHNTMDLPCALGKTISNETYIADLAKMPHLLEAEHVIRCNDEFHSISDNVREDIGTLDSKRIFLEWNEWLKRDIKKKNMKIAEEE